MTKLTPQQLQRRLRSAPSTGERWRHPSGAVYRVLTTGLLESDLTPHVVFEVENTAEVYVCPLNRWGKNVLLPISCDVSSWDARPRPGSHWRHQKGNTYRVVTNGFSVPAGGHLVVYKADAGGQVWLRPAAEYLGCNESAQKRFTMIPH